ncbi:MAG: nucleotidyltransferase domain-containing protein [Phycisphaeraceae bacterium]|nr:nucleotidyltransferase domain-containing protein [Phycisphaeraceae bacterium]
MVTRQQVADKITSVKDQLKALGVEQLELFGSIVRDEGKTASDIDFLVTFRSDLKKLSLFDVARVHAFLEELFGCEIDLVMRDCVYPELRERIYGEAVRVA